MPEITPCLWFDGETEEAAAFHVSLLPNSRVERVRKSPADGPAGKAGTALVVEFTLARRNFLALNGGARPVHPRRLVPYGLRRPSGGGPVVGRAHGGGGAAERCGWLRDRYGVPWQVVPAELPRMLGDPDKARRVMEAMLGMVKLDVAALRPPHDGAPPPR